ncbi:MAG: HAMP domain-containing histidine kinase [Planctomycetes bacterium]|nr:HAMP domain-containing histidine kinase [Planctomycetota bacterium]
MPISRFSLTRYFLVAGLLSAVVVASGVSVFTAREVYADLEDKSEDYAALIAHNLNRQVHERFVGPTLARDGFVDLERPDHLAALDAVVRLGVAELRIRNVYFFDLQGRIVYSTQPEHRGFVVHGNPSLQRALEGHVATLLVDRGSPLDISGEPDDLPLLETYVPIPQLGPDGAPTGQLGGVIEVYQEAAQLLREAARARRHMAAISTLGVVFLMVVLWLRIRQAERALDERTRDLVQANATLAALSRDLERQVEDRTRRLLRAETLASVGTLSAGVAHEINNPIAAIASCAEGLLRRLGAAGQAACQGEEFQEYLQIIRDEAFRVKDITRDLLDFSRAGGSPAGPVGPVDLCALLQATARLVAYRCEREQKPIELDLPAEPLVITGEGPSLRQLLLNVTVNALDASPAGSPVGWRARATPDGGALLVCEDRGRGMTPEELTRALEPFYTKKPVGQGTGLGLAIAYAVARRHGGSIELESAGEGQGARVTVRLSGAADAGAGGEGA